MFRRLVVWVLALTPALSTAMQSLNLDALRMLRLAVARPSLLIPGLSLDTVAELDVERLHARGIRAIVFDKDNTLTRPYSNEPTAAATRIVASAVRVFGRDKCAVLSNSAGSSDDLDFREATAAERALGIQVIRHRRKKPACVDDVEAFHDDLNTIALVGDRLLTDVLFANIAGMFPVHLRSPITLKGDNGPAIAFRAIENAIILPIALRLAARRRPHE